jgi:hypothetical protein
MDQALGFGGGRALDKCINSNDGGNTTNGPALYDGSVDRFQMAAISC